MRWLVTLLESLKLDELMGVADRVNIDEAHLYDLSSAPPSLRPWMEWILQSTSMSSWNSWKQLLWELKTPPEETPNVHLSNFRSSKN